MRYLPWQTELAAVVQFDQPSAESSHRMMNPRLPSGVLIALIPGAQADRQSAKIANIKVVVFTGCSILKFGIVKKFRRKSGNESKASAHQCGELLILLMRQSSTPLSRTDDNTLDVY
jgi:hypothetical protein